MARTSVSPSIAILGFLVPGPKHGYELYQEFDDKIGRVWQVGRSKLYTELKTLEEGGLVSCETQWPKNQRPRKVYQITDQGRKTFLDWLNQATPNLRRIRIELLTRLFFFHYLALDGLDELVAAQKQMLLRTINSLNRKGDETDDEYWRMVLAFRKGQLAAVVEWLDSSIKTP